MDVLPRFGPCDLSETTFPTTTTVWPRATLVAAIGLIAVTAATVATLFSFCRGVAQGEKRKHGQGRYQKRPFHDSVHFLGEEGNCTSLDDVLPWNFRAPTRSSDETARWTRSEHRTITFFITAV